MGATTLGLDGRLERCLAYVFIWISGLFLLVFEKDRTVRWHALQSIAVFGPLSLLWVLVGIVKGFLSTIPILNLVTNSGLGLLLNGIFWVGVILWVWLIVMAWINPDYRLPYVSGWIKRWA